MYLATYDVLSAIMDQCAYIITEYAVPTGLLDDSCHGLCPVEINNILAYGKVTSAHG